MNNENNQLSSSSAQPAAVSSRVKRPLTRVRFALLLLVGSLAAGGLGAYVVERFMSDDTRVINNQSVVLQEGELVASVASQVSSSVVSIVTESTGRNLYGISTIQQGAGSGIIISQDGYVMTNKHVVNSSAKNVEVILSDGTSYEDVEFVGSDPTNDIAFLKIRNVSGLKPAKLGDSSSLKVGQKVIAIGNALGQYQNTVTTGIISGTSRPVMASDANGSSVEALENLLQTDAAINPGNSGGPLVGLNGEIIGINTAVASQAEGIGFAIPINDAKGMIKTLLADGKVVKPYVGVRYVSITPDVVKQYNLKVKNGAYVIAGQNSEAIVAGSPAEKAGLKEGDIITRIDDTPVDSSHPFASLVAQHSVGDKIKLTYWRDGKESVVEVTLAAR